MDFKELVSAFATKLGVSVPTEQLSGTYTFKIAEDISIDLIDNPPKNQFFLSNIVYYPPISGKDRRAILTICLEANFFAQGTNGATFAFDRASNAVIFFRTFSAERTNFPLFLRALDDLIFHVREWRHRFDEKDYYGSWRQAFKGMGSDDIQPYWTKI